MNKDNNNKLKKYKATRLKAARGFSSFERRGREDERDNSKSSITRKQPRNKEEYDKMKKDGTLFGGTKKEPKPAPLLKPKTKPIPTPAPTPAPTPVPIQEPIMKVPPKKDPNPRFSIARKPVSKPIPQAPKKPIQQGIPSKNTRNINDPKGPIDTKLSKAVLKAPTKQPIKNTSIGGVGGGKFRMTNTRAISLEERQANEKAQLEFEKAQLLAQEPNRIVENKDRVTDDVATTTKPTTFQKAPIESKRPDVVQPQETFIENLDTAANNIDTTFRQAPTTGKGSDQMFIGREGDDVVTTTKPTTFQRAPVQEDPRDSVVFAQAAQTAQQTASNEVIENLPNKLGFKFSQEELDKIAANVQAAIDEGVLDLGTGGNGAGGAGQGGAQTGWWTAAGYDNLGQALQSGEFTYKDGQWVKKDGTENDAQDAVDEELITARGRAEQILQGDMSGIPQAAAPKEVEVGEEGVAKTMEEREALTAAQAEVSAAPEVATIEDVTTAKTPEQLQAETYKAELVTSLPNIEPIIGELSDDAIAKVTEINKLSGPVIAEQVTKQAVDAAKATTVDGILSAGAFVPEVDDLTPEKVSDTPDAEAKTREALTGEPSVGTAAQIVEQVGYTAAKRRPVKGTAAKGAAASMLGEVSELPDEITAAIVEDPATVEAQLDTGADPEVVAAIAALPIEALVSSQMENLLGGMEDGNIPLWARPAVDAINSNMAARGMSVSTVGRDALFNSIIQSAMPMAQSNAQALQQRASQNLSNQQQANLQQASQTQQIRMQNLANRQDAASQTAQMAQQMGVLQSQFKQEAVMTSEQQEQQIRVENLRNRQQATVLNTQNEQAMNAQNLGNEQQTELANLEILNQTERENMSAENQEKLSEMNIAAEFIAKNADFKQQMNLANLSNDQQMTLANLSAKNQAGADNLNAAQQTELANLNKTMQMNIKNAELAQQMGIANLNVDQQRAMANANTVANMDMANFNNEQQVVLANSKFMQTATLANLDTRQQAAMQNATAMAALDLATVDQRTKLSVTNAQSFLAMDMANLSNEQQASMLKSQMEQQQLLSNQSANNAAQQFNASSDNQTNQFMASLANQVEQFNANQLNTAEQFNASQTNARDALEFQVEADLEKANASMVNQINQFNEQTAFERNKFNTANAQAIEQSNLAWRRQSNTINTAAANQVSMQNAQNAFNMTSQAQSFLWQELRDQANYTFQAGENEENRKAQLYAQALANEGGSAENWKSNVDSIGTLINSIFGGT